MSIIAFDKGVLVADTLGCQTINDTSIWTKMKKLFISPTNKFAYGVVGYDVLTRHQETFHDQIHSALIALYSDDKLVSDGPSPLFKAVDGKISIVITNDRVYFNGVEIDPSSLCAEGTNANAFIGARMFYPDVVKAVRVAVKYVTGHDQELNVIKMSDLIPFNSSSDSMALAVKIVNDITASKKKKSKVKLKPIKEVNDVL